MREMAEVSRLTPELERSATTLARAFVMAARNWVLYPLEHPAVVASVDRLLMSLRTATECGVSELGITPRTLLVNGTALDADTRVGEMAALLHDRDIVRLTLSGNISDQAVRSLLTLVCLDTTTLRERGGPERVWAEQGHSAIQLEQIDYRKVFEDRDVEPTETPRGDDLWQSIVQSILDRRKTLDEAAQQRLLRIAGDVDAIAVLAAGVMAPNCTPDGSPLVRAQALAVLAAYRQLASIVSVMAPDQLDKVMESIAAATADLNPHVAMQVVQSDVEESEPAGVPAVRRVTDAFDDLKVARMFAAALALDGRASDRVAQVFDTIAPDEERKRRVLTLTRSLLTETDFGATDKFKSFWSATEDLLMKHNERPFVPAAYRHELDNIAGRVAAASISELPPEHAEWMATLEQENVRRLSVRLLIDLFHLETDTARALELVRDMGGLAEDLFLSGEYDDALEVIRMLADARSDAETAVADACRNALDALAGAPAMHDAVVLLDEMAYDEYQLFRSACELIGPPSVDTLQAALNVETLTRAGVRASEIIVAIGPSAASRLAPLAEHDSWFAQRNAARLLGRIGSSEAVPLLQPLVKAADTRVTAEAVRALSHIDDPSAARALHAILRTVTGEPRRVVVQTLVAERDRRVVPLLVRIIGECDPFGSNHALVVETVQALGVMRDDSAVQPLAMLMRRRKWFSRGKTMAVRRTCIEALDSIASTAAFAAVDEAGTTGDRMLRRLVRELVR